MLGRIETLIRPSARRAQRDARISNMATQMIRDILDGTGPVGTRMSLSREPQPETGEPHPLTKELLKAVDYHPLVVRTLQFTQRVLPVEHFLREDGKTPYIRHVERTALLYLDLLPKNMPADEKAVHVAIVLGHDSEEVPQERYMENLAHNLTLPPDKQIDPHERGGLTQEEVRRIFEEEMAGIHPKFARRVKEIYRGIHTFNCNKPDNSPMSDAEYLAQLEGEGHAAKKIIDRAGDSPLGDEFRIARIIKDTPIDDMETWATLPTRYERLERSLGKAERLRPMARRLPRKLRGVEEFYEATLRAGRDFPVEATKRLEARLQGSATEVVIFRQRRAVD